MKYIALLRGINVGGNSLIKMVELKLAFEKSGYTNVVTYINSGNVIFESDEKDLEKITKKLEKNLSEEFSMPLRVVVRSQKELQEVAEDIPVEWKKEDVRKYVAFVKEPIQSDEAIKEFELKEGVDSVKQGNHVIYMTTKLEGLTKTRFTKLAGKKIYKDITIRNFNTVEKILGIMERV